MERATSKLAALLMSAALLVSAVPGASAQNASGKKDGKAITMNVNLVLVPVTVINSFNGFVSGLQKKNFIVFENGVQKEILSFSKGDTPLSVCIVHDTSGSMEGKRDKARDADREFVKAGNPQDEFCLVAFNEGRAELVSHFAKAETIQNKIMSLGAHGRTPLIDAIYLAFSEMKSAKPENRKVIYIISDGGDNASRYNENDIKESAKESDVQIYAIGIFDPTGYRRTPEESYGPEFLKKITEMTGGRMIEVEDLKDIEEAASKIGRELREMYVLGYMPSAKEWETQKYPDNFRKVKVKLLPPKGMPPLKHFARSGYYAPKQ